METLTHIFSLFWDCIDYCYVVLVLLFRAFEVNYLPFFICFAAVLCLFRLLFKPIVGASDSAFQKKMSDARKSNKSNKSKPTSK